MTCKSSTHSTAQTAARGPAASVTLVPKQAHMLGWRSQPLEGGVSKPDTSRHMQNMLVGRLRCHEPGGGHVTPEPDLRITQLSALSRRPVRTRTRLSTSLATWA